MSSRPSQPDSSRPSPAPHPWLPELLHLHGPRILVVEDDRELEPLVRRAAATLRPVARVDWCTSTEEAHALLEMRFYDAVLADWNLEGAHAGLALRVDCWQLQPQAVFAMTSSYPLSSYLHSVGRPGIPFLAKPFDVWGCREFLASLLASGEGAES
jgi:DNA-binding NtrC family response regulator